MKKLLTIFLAFFFQYANATNYYFSASGNDSNNGTSTSSAWQTIAKFNSVFASRRPGDSLLFNRGDTFRGSLVISRSGSVGNPMIIEAYGSGAKPLILGSKDISSTISWTNVESNIWKTTSSIVSVIKDMGNLIFNNEASFGVKKTTLGGCTSQGDFFFNTKETLIYMYSVGNPGTYYKHIEAGGVYSENIVSVSNRSYLTLSNLDVRYSANNGIFLENSDNIIIENCDVSWIGGMYYGGGPTRMGNGIQMWVNNSNIILRYNRINQIYDAGISPQGGGTYTQSNINMYYNVISNCYYSFEFWAETGATCNNINFYNNTCVNAGSSWSAFQRPDGGNGRHVMIWQLAVPVTGINIKNNIFKTCTDQAVRLGNGISYLHIDYNLYDVTKVAKYGSSSYTTLAQWQAATLCDDNSIASNPLFTDLITYNIQSTSPAINAGLDVGLTTDYIGNTIVGLPDIGAFEFRSNHPPSIQDQGFQLNENSPGGTAVGTVVASDPDAGQILTYSIVSGNTNGAFAINALTGVLSVANGATLNVDFALVVKVLDNGIGELSSEATITINIIPTGIELTGNNKAIKVYPNPVSDELIIEIEGNKDRLGFEILNSIGQIVFEGNLSEKTVVQTTNFSPGVYLIKLENRRSLEFKKIGDH